MKITLHLPYILLPVLLCILTGSCSKTHRRAVDAVTSKVAESRVKTNEAGESRLYPALAEFYKQILIDGEVGIFVYDLTEKKEIFGRNADRPMPTASCMKLLTGICAYHYFGTDYRFSPPYLRDSILYPGTNPYLTDAELIKARGKYKSVALPFKSRVKAEKHWYPWDLSVSRFGSVYRMSRFLTKDSARAEGFTVSEPHFIGPSVSLDMVVSRMWKNSSNIMATSMLYALGHRMNPAAKPDVAGVNVLRHFLREKIGVKSGGMNIHDGCGLCPQNKLSPRVLTQILRYGFSDPRIKEKLTTLLSISGTDGTLRSLLPEARTRGMIRGKTGTLSHPYGISTLAGFARSSDGHLLVFALMTQKMSVLDAHVIQRKFCRTLLLK